MAGRSRYPAPRWQTPLPDDVIGSWGPDVAAWAESELGIRLDRWQRRALNRALAYRADGTLVHRHYLISTARQNGKTTLVRALIGWALTALRTPPWTMIYGLAHDKTQARIPYRAVAADLRPIADRVGPIGRGGLAITQYLGIRSAMYGRPREYHYGSREARDAVRGESVDHALFDEVRTQRDYDTWLAIEPTTRARPDPLILGISSAGDERSVLLRDWWERGLRIIDGAEPAGGFGMTWYAPPDELEPGPRAELYANPAIADGRLNPAAVTASLHSLGPAGYRAETLNLWSDAQDEWLPPGLWRDTIGAQPSQKGARVILGVEAVPSWRRATVTVALALDEGVAWVGVAGELDASRTAAATVSPDDLVALLAAQADAWRPEAVAYSAAAAAAPHVEAWAKGADVRSIPLGPRQIRAASELFRSELIGRRLHHPDDPLLALQVRVARPSSPIEAGGWYFGIRESTGEVDALRASAWASWAAIAPDEPPPMQVQIY